MYAVQRWVWGECWMEGRFPTEEAARSRVLQLQGLYDNEDHEYQIVKIIEEGNLKL